jgi:hypothetical protein
MAWGLRALITLSVLVACLLETGFPASAQETVALIRFVTAREGGPVPVGETTAFEATDPKAVAWVRLQPRSQTHSIAFRWFDAERKLQRVSPTRLLTPGEDVVWDELPIRGAPATNLPGAWTVELYADERLLTSSPFSILPPRATAPSSVRVRHQTTLTTKSQETRTGTTAYTHSVITSLDHLVQVIRLRPPDRTFLTVLSLGKLWGTSEGVRGSGLLSYSIGGRFFIQGGLEGSRVTDLFRIPPLRTDMRALFFDLRYSPPQGLPLSLSYRRETMVDDRFPHLTDLVTTSWALSSSYFMRNLSLSLTYTIQDVDDSTSTNFDLSTRTFTVTGVYFPTPQLFLFVTRTSVTQDFGLTSFSSPFSQRTDTTSTRLNYQPHPRLSLALFTFQSDFSRSDGLFSFSTSQRGVEAAYQLSQVVALRALTQWQEQTSTFGGFTSVSNQRLTRYGADFVLGAGLRAGVAFSPQTTKTGTTVNQTDIFTAYASFFPNSRLFFNSSYTLTRTTGTGSDTTSETLILFMRYAPNAMAEYQAQAQFTDVRFPAFPSGASYNALYQITATFRF